MLATRTKVARLRIAIRLRLGTWKSQSNRRAHSQMPGDHALPKEVSDLCHSGCQSSPPELRQSRKRQPALVLRRSALSQDALVRHSGFGGQTLQEPLGDFLLGRVRV